MTCGRTKGAYLATTISSIQSAAILAIFGALGVSKIGDAEGEGIPCVLQLICIFIES